jgi:hypothetical protein
MSNWWANVCYWHIADVDAEAENVRFRGDCVAKLH